MGDEGRGLLGIRQRSGLAGVALADRLGQRPHRHQHVHPGIVDQLTELGMVVARLGAELEHVPEHRHAPGGAGTLGGRGEIRQGSAHRHRVGVVAAVEERYPAGERHYLASAGREAQRNAARRRHAHGLGRGHRGKQIRPQVGLTERDLELDPLTSGVDHDTILVLLVKPHVPALTEGDGPDVAAKPPVQQALPGGDDRGGARRQGPDQLRLGGRDRLDRSQELEVDGPDAHDHRDVGLGDLRELGDLALAAHRHLEHENLRARGSAVQWGSA